MGANDVNVLKRSVVRHDNAIIATRADDELVCEQNVCKIKGHAVCQRNGPVYDEWHKKMPNL
jgi:hypothetical protein